MKQEEQGQMQAQKDSGRGEPSIGFSFQDVDIPERPDDLLAQMETAMQEERAALIEIQDQKYALEAQRILDRMEAQAQAKKAKRGWRSCRCW